ncbi:hypothetical protein ACFV3R_07995 [Streptomyces sp. NPDC059740]|uniref:hypothetical protein n=1 Tax=Streptomyces sp. NPDC059740 TaxID=3346926 RepID=UPI0036672C3D
MFADARVELEKAIESVSHRHFFRYKNASHVIVGQIHLDAAHNILLRLSQLSDVVPMLPGVLAFVRENLRPDDPRRLRVEKISHTVSEGAHLDEKAREALLDAMGMARQTNIAEKMRLRSFVYAVWWAMIGLTVLAALAALLGSLDPGKVPLCFTPHGAVVCPLKENRARSSVVPVAAGPTAGQVSTPADYLVVELVGLAAASIAATVTLRRMRGNATPFAVPMTLALLKLPTGALTAVLGILLMRGQFVPGLSNLDNSAQIIAWAIVFGYAQQIFTGLVDTQARALLHTAGNDKTAADPAAAAWPASTPQAHSRS